LKKSIKDNKKFVLICSNPDSIEQNSKYLELDIEALNMSGIVFDEYVVLDNRNKTKVQEVLSDSSLIMLCGGNTYQQNKFFNEINLKKYISNIDAPVIGISAGSINAADNVYNSPECEEDIENPHILAGLNLTKINIEPHFDINSNNKIQMNSILSESHNRKIYGLPDGSYIKNDNIYGKCYVIHNGEIELICEDGEQYKICD
jgi:dipeptidase E